LRPESAASVGSLGLANALKQKQASVPPSSAGGVAITEDDLPGWQKRVARATSTLGSAVKSSAESSIADYSEDDKDEGFAANRYLVPQLQTPSALRALQGGHRGVNSSQSFGMSARSSMASPQSSQPGRYVNDGKAFGKVKAFVSFSSKTQ
jgi:hypothetical protein